MKKRKMSRKKVLHEKKEFRLIHHRNRCISVEFAQLPGKRISTGTYDDIDAIVFAKSFIKEGKLACLIDGEAKKEAPTMGDYAKDFFTRTDCDSIRYYDVCHDKKLSAYCYKQRQDLLDNYIIPHYKNVKLANMTTQEIDRWIVSLKGKVVKNLATGTKNKILTTLKIILDHAVYQGILVHNPAANVKAFTERVKHERRALTKEELDILFPPTAEERIGIWGSLLWAVYFSILLDTGMRPGECAGISPSSVFYTENGMAIATTQSISCVTHDVQKRVKTTGHGYDQRVGLLSPVTADLIKRYIRENKERIKKAPREEPFLQMDDYRAKRKYITVDTSNKRWKETLEQFGIPICTQYCLRHTFLTMHRGTIEESILALSMGHVKLRDKDYNHQDASMLISQLEENREAFFKNDSTKKGIITLSEIL